MRPFVLLLLLLPLGVRAQCFGTEQFPLTTVVPDPNGAPTTISTQSWAGDYAVVSLTAGHSYRFSSTVATDHITVSTAAASGALAFGVQPLIFTAAATEVYYANFHTNASCGVQQVFRTTQLQRVHCEAGTGNCGGSDESIIRVTMGAIDNFSNGCGANGYSDFSSQSTSVLIGEPVPITVLNSTPYAGDQVHVFVDWDHNFNFGDAGETFVLGTTDNITFTGTITAPSGATAGPVRMRVRLTYTGSVPACGNTLYGEVEDYTLNVDVSGNVVFLGGNGRGDAQLAFSNGITLAQFQGGDGRGDTQLAFSNGIALAQFQGGSGRGDVQLAFSNAIAQSQFLGGDGRGDVQLAFAGTGRSQFAGGDGRGDVQLAFGNGFALAQFQGGDGRGDVQLAFAGMGRSQFAGGDGRGDVQLAVLGFQRSQYAGGDGRGDVQLAFNNAVALAQFQGGEGRGDVMLSFNAVIQAEVLLALRAMLDGPYSNTTGLMNDALRGLAAFPLVQPYNVAPFNHAGTEQIQPQVLQITGNDAIVDWVLVELRDAATPSIVITRKAGLIQRDGDIVATDGISPLTFNQPPGTYHVALRHRNHLGVMTGNAPALGLSATPLDLSSAGTPTFGTNARKSIAGTFPAEVLWAGDVNFNGVIQYTGTGNDRDPILSAIGGVVPTNTTGGYRAEDVNLDGEVRYTGQGNDRDPILQNIGGVVPTNTRLGQLP